MYTILDFLVEIWYNIHANKNITYVKEVCFMKNTRVMFVGGTFDYAGGKPSGLVHQMISALQLHLPELTFYNGGFVDELHNNILHQAKNNDIVIWMPNVPNEVPKMRNIKSVNPKTILVSSKRNDNQKYTFSELINRSLLQKSNLTIEFSKQNDGTFKMMVFDPLGTVYYLGTNINDMVRHLAWRAYELTQFTRVQSIQVEGDKSAPEQPEFFAFARECSDIFHNLINPDAGVTRFLGNMSFRCQNGFPSYRGDDGLIYVSRRNVDKRYINAESFVPTYRGEDGKVCYYGEHKPSVDTPIQQRLYELFPQMNYMLHAHCYINLPGAVQTQHPVPCGALEEVQEIINATMCQGLQDAKLIAVNLVGHGCIIMAESIDKINSIPHNAFFSRPMPEPAVFGELV